MEDVVIAIDGYSGTGKSSTARQVASRLGITYVDSGAMYRAVTLFFLRNNVSPNDEKAVKNALQKVDLSFEFDAKTGHSDIHLNGENVENEIRNKEVSQSVSEIAAISAVRKKLVEQQHQFGKKGSVVMDGRDIGTVVFPNADYKFFMVADATVRARRRLKELQEKGISAELNDVLTNLQERDKTDSSRKDSPLIKADGAIEIDTTDLTFEEQVHKIVNLVVKDKG